MLTRLIRILDLVRTPGAVGAMFAWPKFSLASYLVVSRMKRAGVQPRTIIDVGANVGQFAIAADRLLGEVTVFPIEPDPNVVKELQRNVGKSIAERVLAVAVGDQAGTVPFHVNANRQASSLLPLGADCRESFPEAKIVETISVPLETLDKLFGEMVLTPPVLLKIDVQGYEDRVLAGAVHLLRRVDWVLVEVAFSKLYDGTRSFDFIVEMMAGQSFRFVRPVDFHLSPVTGEITEMDALFARRENAAPNGLSSGSERSPARQ